MKYAKEWGLGFLGMVLFCGTAFSNPAEIQKNLKRLRILAEEATAPHVGTPPTFGEWEWILKHKSHLDTKTQLVFLSYLENNIVRGGIFDTPTYFQLGGKNIFVLRAFLSSLIERTDRLPSDLNPNHLHFFRHWAGDPRLLAEEILQLLSYAESLGEAHIKPFVLPFFRTLKEMSSETAPPNEQNLYGFLIELPQFRGLFDHLVQSFPNEYSLTHPGVDPELKAKFLEILQHGPGIFAHLSPESLAACVSDLSKIARGRNFRKY